MLRRATLAALAAIGITGAAQAQAPARNQVVIMREIDADRYDPARTTALAFAIVGSFEDAIDTWRQHAARFADGNDGVILAATSGAIATSVSLSMVSTSPAASAVVRAGS